MLALELAHLVRPNERDPELPVLDALGCQNLPSDQRSGLNAVRDILDDVREIDFVEFGGEDVVRHRLVQRIVDAYDSAESGGQATGRG